MHRLSIDLPDWLIARLSSSGPLADRRARMQFAIDLSRENVERKTGGPFGAIIVETESGRLISGGVNLVEHQANAVLHAEIVAIMFAQRALAVWTLAQAGFPGYELVTSSTPCAMCLGAVLWSGVTSLVCGARGDDVERIGFDEGPVFEESFEYLRRRGVTIAHDVMRDEARVVLAAYQVRGGTIYNR